MYALRKVATHVDALALYNKYTDVFYMEDVPEAERRETARQVAERLRPRLRAVAAAARQDAIPVFDTCTDTQEAGDGQDCSGGCADG